MGKKIFKFSIVLHLSCCQITVGIQGKITLHCNIFTCPSDIGWKHDCPD